MSSRSRSGSTKGGRAATIAAAPYLTKNYNPDRPAAQLLDSSSSTDQSGAATSGWSMAGQPITGDSTMSQQQSTIPDGGSLGVVARNPSPAIVPFGPQSEGTGGVVQAQGSDIDRRLLLQHLQQLQVNNDNSQVNYYVNICARYSFHRSVDHGS